MPSIEEKIKNKENDTLFTSDELDCVLLIPKGTYKTLSFDADVTPGAIQDEVESISARSGVPEDIIYDILTPLFSVNTDDELETTYYTFTSGGSTVTDFDSVTFTWYNDETTNGDILDKNEELESLKAELEETRKELEKARSELDAIADKERLELAEEIVSIRKKKGLLEDEECESELSELKDLPMNVLEKVLNDAKKISAKLSDPEPKVRENKDESQESEEEVLKEKIRKELGLGSD